MDTIASIEADTASGFYRVVEGKIQYAPNRVAAKGYMLEREKWKEYTYPVDGWYYFETFEVAEKFFASPDNNPSLLLMRIGQMEEACRNYLEMKGDVTGMSGRIHWSAGPMIFAKAEGKKVKCGAIKKWTEDIWGLYYTRLATINATGKWDDKFLDFSPVGPCPYSMLEAMQE